MSALIEDAGKAKVVSEIIEHLHVVIRVINSGRKVCTVYYDSSSIVSMLQYLLLIPSYFSFSQVVQVNSVPYNFVFQRRHTLLIK